MNTMLPSGVKENWTAGEQAYYEYHCLESMESSDAHLWMRSHQVVTILSRNVDDEVFNGVDGLTFPERAEEGAPTTYQIKFSNGLVGCAWEDELFTGSHFYYRPDPPKV